MGLPCIDFLREQGEAGDSAVQALAGQRAEFDLGNIEPTAMLWGVVELDAFGQTAGLGRGKGFVKRGGRVSIEVIEDKSDLDRPGVASSNMPRMKSAQSRRVRFSPALT